MSLTDGTDANKIAVVSRDDAAKALAVVAPEDETVSFVAGKTDVNGQQLTCGSWTLDGDAGRGGDAEVVEAQAINCVAPFILCSKLQPLLARRRSCEIGPSPSTSRPWRASSIV